ncbi:immunity 26/phosphotriesterase HocA family protein [Streptomyces sp. NPDC055506]
MPLIKMNGQRRQHLPGDIFALQPEGHGFRFGRIVKIGQSGSEGRFPGGVLVYVYDVLGESEEPDRSVLTPDRLLSPPFFTATWPWSKGYFRTVGHEELVPAALLQHCFFRSCAQR